VWRGPFLNGLASCGAAARQPDPRLCLPSAPPKRDCAGHRSRARPDGVAVIAAPHDPLTVFLAYDFTDVVTPDDDGPNRWATGVRSVAGPGPREVERGSGIAADLRAHVPTAPCGGASRIMMTAIMMMMTRPGLCTRPDQTKHCRCSHEETLHGCSLLRGRSRYAITKPLKGGTKSVPSGG
jgi:hypothetical protein